ARRHRQPGGAMNVRHLIVMLALLAGCGYSQSGNYNQPVKSGYKWQSLYRQDVQTVAVPTFQTKDFHTGVEFRLSKAVVHQLEVNTPYKVVDRDRADTILEGEIVNVRANPLSTASRTNNPQEQLLTLTVNFIWKDLR